MVNNAIRPTALTLRLFKSPRGQLEAQQPSEKHAIKLYRKRLPKSTEGATNLYGKENLKRTSLIKMMASILSYNNKCKQLPKFFCDQTEEKKENDNTICSFNLKLYERNASN